MIISVVAGHFCSFPFLACLKLFKEVILREAYVHVEKKGVRTGQRIVAHKAKDIIFLIQVGNQV